MCAESQLIYILDATTVAQKGGVTSPSFHIKTGEDWDP